MTTDLARMLDALPERERPWIDIVQSIAAIVLESVMLQHGYIWDAAAGKWVKT